MSLKTYHAKRHFDRTREPKGGKQPAPAKGTRGFVVHKHAASHLHYDFRLELEGVLKSWAVPKGPSLDPGDKRLAVEVEDHPIEYATFEGTIPAGEYGGGTVMVWDRGSWTPKAGTNPHAALRSGRLEFELAGDKLRGAWMLVRMGNARSGGKPQWLLRKLPDSFARPAAKQSITDASPKSVKTGRTMEQIAKGNDPQWSSNRKASGTPTPTLNGKAPATAPAKTRKKKGASRTSPPPGLPSGGVESPMPREIEPQLATLVDKAPRGDEWIHEVKFDGYRILAFMDKGRVRLISRNGKDWTDRFPQIAAEVEKLPIQTAIVDGEVVAVDASGRSAFQLLQGTLKNSTTSGVLAYYVFDLLYLNGSDLRATSLHDRRTALKSVLDEARALRIVRFSDSIEGHGGQVLQQACKLALEGIVSKRADSAYVSGRTAAWVKSKCTNRQEMVIGGFTDPQKSRTGLGALLIGHYEGDNLKFAGKVGTGLDTAMLRTLTSRLKQLEQKAPAFVDPPRGAEARGAHWVRPEMVCEIEFFEWTKEGKMRHPAFIELREDKPATEVVRERRKPVAVATRQRGAVARTVARSAPSPAPAPSRTPKSATAVAGVEITHADREVFADVGVTKGELAAYYDEVSRWMLPHVKGRPLSVVRCPQGQGSQCFYQKNWERGETVGSHVATIRLASASIESLVIDHPSALVWLVQRGVLEMHTWGCTEAALEQPDRMVFDLDPSPELPWSAVVRAAKLLRAKLEDRGLPPLVKTTGGKGLHVVVPLKPKASWDAVKAYSKALADEIAGEKPDQYVATMSKAQRTGRIFIDYLRNNRGATFVAPYSSRSRPGAPVAMPMTWDDLLSRRTRPVFTVRDALKWLAKNGDAWKNGPRPRVLPE